MSRIGCEGTMPAVDWGSIPTDVLNSVSERCASTSVAALRGVSRHWNRTNSRAKRCRCTVSARQRPVEFQLPPLRDFSHLKVVELCGVNVVGSQIEALVSSEVLKALAVRECLVDVRTLYMLPRPAFVACEKAFWHK